LNKVISAGIAAALVLFMILLGVVSMSLGGLVKSAVESAGPRVLGAPVTIGSVTISPLSGRGTLRDLVIGNPAGFSTPRAISVGAVEIELKLSSLMSNMIVVNRLAVRDPELVWEIGQGSSNIARLEGNAQEAAAKLGAGKSAPSPKASPAAKGKSLLIRDFSVSGGKVGLAATALGGQGLSAPLPAVHLTDLGGPGRSPAEAAAQAFTALTHAAQGAASDIGGKALDSARGAAMKALGELFRKGGK